ncbi:MAG: hypothetical protein KDC99_05710 [Cyclobacteriaceae bacterium]|nr:hypothetical protein [Cyclobacteriaceae bacterium]
MYIFRVHRSLVRHDDKLVEQMCFLIFIFHRDCHLWTMELYNPNSTRGVRAYEIGEDYIIISFHNGSYDYKFTHDSAGKGSVEVMKLLAKEGKGLAAYLSTQVKDKYESKTPVKNDDRTNFMNIKFE